MKITIDGQQCEASRGEFILNVALKNCIHIPALCHNAALPGLASCRLCVVEVIEGAWSKVVASCVYPITSEIEVVTASEKIIRMRKTLLMLLGARAPQNTYIRKLMQEYGVAPPTRLQGDKDEHCVMCGLCVSACEKMGANSISTVNRGITKKVATPYDEPSKTCIGCAACAAVCPTGAIGVTESHGKRRIWNKEFELVSCSVCGKPFITPEQVAYLKSNLEQPVDELVCETCKRVIAGKRLGETYANVTVSKGYVR
ncbi:NADP-reducing hydrogenase subunit HndC [Pelotomaculum sp. FP]|uniref:2Fe-2S iron-sulfur cluster-binding protein n=1 Tax=Pelotomaculum sp. FP TaxID=261474 RepID=UPI0010646879|nr:2Fe-2S iron-sulfur cluster-binding protein [Pelotomaculum sp. FP]TEB16400.1 NADP-reducing hydrogenase subunit HndC [Pelotomaculum sp. FP]